jgi:hypothetical protein
MAIAVRTTSGSLGDEERRRAVYGASDTDGEAPRVASGWFRHVDDGTPLAAATTEG